jgi:excisionase family DNA binding protein
VPADQLLTAEQVAKRMAVSKQAVWELARESRIPVIRISDRRLRFHPEDVERWLDRRTTTVPRGTK